MKDPVAFAMSVLCFILGIVYGWLLFASKWRNK